MESDKRVRHVLKPDLSTATIDPFFAQATLVLVCDISEPTTGAAYNRDPRSTAKAAIEYMASQGIGDTAFFGPEAEFFVFDDVKFDVQMNGDITKSIALKGLTIQPESMKKEIQATDQE